MSLLKGDEDGFVSSLIGQDIGINDSGSPEISLYINNQPVLGVEHGVTLGLLKLIYSSDSKFQGQLQGVRSRTTSDPTSVPVVILSDDRILDNDAYDLIVQDPNNADEHSLALTSSLPDSLFTNISNDIADRKKGQFVCEFCHLPFVSKAKFQRHRRIHTEVNPYVCVYCHQTFPHHLDLRKHREEHHVSDKPFKCSYCPKTFSTRAELRGHLWRHTGEKNHKCRICSKTFATKGNLKLHIDKHIGLHKHKCPFCPQRFTSHSSLEAHMAKHTGLKAYKCRYCTKSYAQAGQLTSHERLHTGEKPFTCGVCGKGFRLNSTRLAHEKRHSGARPHICDTCGRSFAMPDHLRCHMKTHLNKDDRIVACPFCSKRIFQGRNMRKHLFRHRELNLTELQAKMISASLRPDIFQEAMNPEAPDEGSINDAAIGQHKGPLQCRRCVSEFKTTKKLFKHLSDVHYQRDLTSAERKQIRFEYGLQKLHRCQHCTSVFADFRLLRSHVVSDHPDQSSQFGYTRPNQYKCPNCSMEFDLRTDLEEHILNAHLSTGVSSSSTNERMLQFRCWYCEDSFATPEEVVGHMTNQHESLDVLSKRVEEAVSNDNVSTTGLWACPHCPMNLKTEAEYNSHLATHGEQQPILSVGNINDTANASRSLPSSSGSPWVCLHCPMNFKNEVDYNAHIAVHANVAADFTSRTTSKREESVDNESVVESTSECVVEKYLTTSSVSTQRTVSKVGLGTGDLSADVCGAGYDDGGGGGDSDVGDSGGGGGGGGGGDGDGGGDEIMDIHVDGGDAGCHDCDVQNLKDTNNDTSNDDRTTVLDTSTSSPNSAPIGTPLLPVSCSAEFKEDTSTEIHFSTSYTSNTTNTCPVSTTVSSISRIRYECDENIDVDVVNDLPEVVDTQEQQSFLDTPPNPNSKEGKSYSSGVTSSQEISECNAVKCIDFNVTKELPEKSSVANPPLLDVDAEQHEQTPVARKIPSVGETIDKTDNEYTTPECKEKKNLGSERTIETQEKAGNSSRSVCTSTKTASKEIPFRCWFCSDTFKTPEDVVVHMTKNHENLDNLSRCIEMAEMKSSAPGSTVTVMTASSSASKTKNAMKMLKLEDTSLPSDVSNLSCPMCKEKVVGNEAFELHMMMHRAVAVSSRGGSSSLSQMSVVSDIARGTDKLETVFAPASALPSMVTFTDLKGTDDSIPSTSTQVTVSVASEGEYGSGDMYSQIQASNAEMDDTIVPSLQGGVPITGPCTLSQDQLVSRTSDEVLETSQSFKSRPQRVPSKQPKKTKREPRRERSKELKVQVSNNPEPKAKAINVNMCSHCNRVFCTQRALDVHTYKMHGKQYISKTQCKLTTTPFNCWFCSLHFSTPEQVVEHMTSVHESLDSLSKRVEDQQDAAALEQTRFVIVPDKWKSTRPSAGTNRFVNIVPKTITGDSKLVQRTLIPISPSKQPAPLPKKLLPAKGISYDGLGQATNHTAPPGFKMSYALAYVPVYVPKEEDKAMSDEKGL